MNCFVGQPILAAAAFQPALVEGQGSPIARKSRLERRLQARLPAPLTHAHKL